VFRRLEGGLMTFGLEVVDSWSMEDGRGATFCFGCGAQLQITTRLIFKVKNLDLHYILPRLYRGS